MEANQSMQRELAKISELNQRLNLEVTDYDFPEAFESLWPGDPKDVSRGAPLQFQALHWQPTRGPLFLDHYNANLEYGASHSVLEFNRDLSGLLGILAQYPDLLKSYFPQTDMYYSPEDDERVGQLDKQLDEAGSDGEAHGGPESGGHTTFANK